MGNSAAWLHITAFRSFPAPSDPPRPSAAFRGDAAPPPRGPLTRCTRGPPGVGARDRDGGGSRGSRTARRAPGGGGIARTAAPSWQRRPERRLRGACGQQRAQAHAVGTAKGRNALKKRTPPAHHVTHCGVVHATETGPPRPRGGGKHRGDKIRPNGPQRGVEDSRAWVALGERKVRLDAVTEGAVSEKDVQKRRSARQTPRRRSRHLPSCSAPFHAPKRSRAKHFVFFSPLHAYKEEIEGVFFSRRKSHGDLLDLCFFWCSSTTTFLLFYNG